EAQQAVQALVDQLLEAMPEEQRNAADPRWLLAQLLNWHRREDKSFWWRYFYLRELTDAERVEELDAIAMLTYLDSRVDPAPKARSTIHRYSFPPQEHKIRL